MINRHLIILLACFLSTFSIAQNYFSAESVEWDPVNDQWLVSNGQNIIADDGEGNKSIFGTIGASYGLEVLNGVLYGSKGNGIIAVDLTTQETLLDMSINGAAFLNGMTTDGDNTIYLTDFSTEKILSVDVSDIKNPVVETIISNTQVKPNGIYYDGDNNRLLFTTWELLSRVMSVDLESKEIEKVVDIGAGFTDGIATDSEGNFYTSSWSPAVITMFASDFSSSSIVDAGNLDSPADIGINKATNILGIPMGASVKFVSVGTINSHEDILSEDNISIIENPVADIFKMQVSDLKSNLESISFFDQTGKLVLKSNIGKVVSEQVFQIDISILNSGIYFISIIDEEGRRFRKTLIKA